MPRPPGCSVQKSAWLGERLQRGRRCPYSQPSSSPGSYSRLAFVSGTTLVAYTERFLSNPLEIKVELKGSTNSGLPALFRMNRDREPQQP
jgi:hypothetical protein